jgi:hypothetical protein
LDIQPKIVLQLVKHNQASEPGADDQRIQLLRLPLRGLDIAHSFLLVRLLGPTGRGGCLIQERQRGAGVEIPRLSTAHAPMIAKPRVLRNVMQPPLP